MATGSAPEPAGAEARNARQLTQQPFVGVTIKSAIQAEHDFIGREFNIGAEQAVPDAEHVAIAAVCPSLRPWRTNSRELLCAA